MVWGNEGNALSPFLFVTVMGRILKSVKKAADESRLFVL